MPSSHQADVFISFIHEESETAEAVQRFVNEMLNREGSAFLSSDKFQIYAGEFWLDRILAELRAAKVVLLLLSEVSVARSWVNFEAGAGWFTGKVIIPVCIKGMTKEELPKPYSSLQAIDLKFRDEQLYLIRSIAHHLGIDEPDLASKYGEAYAALAGEEGEKKLQEQREILERFRDSLDTANKLEEALSRLGRNSLVPIKGVRDIIG